MREMGGQEQGIGVSAAVTVSGRGWDAPYVSRSGGGSAGAL
jgi:hypothetical protein